MKTIKTEYVIYKQISLNMYPIEIYREKLTAVWRLNQFCKHYPKNTYILTKRVITEESLEA